LWGDLHFNEQYASEPLTKQEKDFVDSVVDYVTCKIKGNPPTAKEISNVYIRYIELRGSNRLVGILQDREHEKKTESLEKNNEELAGLLQDAYIPTPDPKVGTL